MPHTLTMEQVMLLSEIKRNAPELRKALVFLVSVSMKQGNNMELPCCPMLLFCLYSFLDEFKPHKQIPTENHMN